MTSVFCVCRRYKRPAYCASVPRQEMGMTRKISDFDRIPNEWSLNLRDGNFTRLDPGEECFDRRLCYTVALARHDLFVPSQMTICSHTNTERASLFTCSIPLRVFPSRIKQAKCSLFLIPGFGRN